MLSSGAGRKALVWVNAWKDPAWASAWARALPGRDWTHGWGAQAFSLFLLWNWSFALGWPYSWWEKPFGTESEFKAQLMAYLTTGT